MTNETLDSVMGRPTKLTDELIAKAREYIYDFRSSDDVIPTIEGLAYYLEIARSTLYKYEADSPDFSDIAERVRQLQAKMLINGGLMGDFNASIAKVMMTKHGYSDKQEIDNTSSDGSMSPQAKPDYSGLTDDELRQYIALESKAASTESGVGKP